MGTFHPSASPAWSHVHLHFALKEDFVHQFMSYLQTSDTPVLSYPNKALSQIPIFTGCTMGNWFRVGKNQDISVRGRRMLIIYYGTAWGLKI